MNQKSIEADKANDEMAQRVERLLAEHHWLSWSDDGSPIFKVEKDKMKDGREVVTLGPAPETPFRWKFVQPKLSVWNFVQPELGVWMATTWDNDPLIKQWREEDMAEIAELEENDLPRGSFGHWSANGSSRRDREWLEYGEDEGIGRA